MKTVIYQKQTFLKQKEKQQYRNNFQNLCCSSRPHNSAFKSRRAKIIEITSPRQIQLLGRKRVLIPVRAGILSR